jgi:hypothetical protein
MGGSSKLVESSRANLVMQGLIPGDESSPEQLARTLSEGRVCEIRMLFYVGRDLVRWINQCLEFIETEQPLRNRAIEFQSFSTLLIEDPPANVKDKLTRWGVVDYKAIFSRAIGLNMVFNEAPTVESLAEEFIRNYYRYADHMYACFQHGAAFAPIESKNFSFDLFASGEYSKLLERQWQEN